MSRRSTETERLDRGEYTIEEYERWHREMWYIHRLLGESRALRKTLGSELTGSSDETVSILDVGCGSGDLLLETRRWKTDTLMFGADDNFLALRATARHQIPVIQCNALRLPFGNSSIDYVMSSLTLHHFSDERAVAFLRELRRVARKNVFVVDLERNPLAYAVYRAFGRFLLQSFTFEDGSLSIRRGFRHDELMKLALAAGYREPVVTRSAAFRLVLTG
ncbi:MAG: methyltransferase domain-containing protein [Pyrinomonadaceae bacterium]|nr:methyltransferase domain-containing protein [Pyrinomonadaceae bacterium]